MAYNSNISDANGKFQFLTEYLHIFLDTRFLEMHLLCVINAIGVKQKFSNGWCSFYVKYSCP